MPVVWRSRMTIQCRAKRLRAALWVENRSLSGQQCTAQSEVYGERNEVNLPPALPRASLASQAPALPRYSQSSPNPVRQGEKGGNF